MPRDELNGHICIDVFGSIFSKRKISGAVFPTNKNLISCYHKNTQNDKFDKKRPKRK